MSNAYNLSHSDSDAYKATANFLELYSRYKAGFCSISQQDKSVIEIYEHLIKNGFEENKISTVLYSYLVAIIVESANKNNLEVQVTNPFSQFYLDAANNIGIGTKTLHSNLLDRPYGRQQIDKIAVATYGTFALDIASHFEKDNKKNKLKIKSKV